MVPHSNEIAARWTAETLHGFLDSAPDAMVFVEPTGIILLVSSQAERLFGYERQELRGQG